LLTVQRLLRSARLSQAQDAAFAYAGDCFGHFVPNSFVWRLKVNEGNPALSSLNEKP
jgi:hypothetical protein